MTAIETLVELAKAQPGRVTYHRAEGSLQRKATLPAADQFVGLGPAKVGPPGVRSLIPQARTTQAGVAYLRDAWTDAAAVVAPKALKPEANMTSTAMVAPVVTIAQTVKLSRQLWEDYPALEAQLESRLLRGLRRVEEAQLLLGTGAGGQMLGLMTAATSQGLTVPLSGQALLDGIQAAAAALTAAGPGYVATGVVLNPSDWIAAQRSQPSLAMASSGLWGLQAAASIAMPVGNFLVGAFDVGCQLYDREDAHVEIADENMDDFVKDLLTARAEERLALAIYTPAAFRKAA